MSWDVIFQPEHLAMYGNGLLTTLWPLLSSLAIGCAPALLSAIALTSGNLALEKIVGAFT